VKKKGKAKAEDNNNSPAPKTTGGEKKLLLIILLAGLLVGGGGAGLAYFLLAVNTANDSGARPMNAEQMKRAAKGEPRYVDLHPDFTIGIGNGNTGQFILIAFSVLTYYDDTEQAIRDNLPIIRNNIILMVGKKSLGELTTEGGKFKLQQEVQAEVESVITHNSAGGILDIDRVFFTKFLMQ
jgi:flagellar FliL protein